MNNFKFNNKGFTLIEILVSITILVLVFAVGVPRYRDYARRQQLDSLARQVRGDLNLVKQRALAGTKPDSPSVACDPPQTLRGHGIFAVAGGGSYQLYAMCSNTSAPSHVMNVRQMPAGYTIVRTFNPSIPTQSTYFKALGHGTFLPEGVDAIFTITHTASSTSTTVTMTSSGEIK